MILIDITSENYAKDYKTLIGELNQYSKTLSKKKKILALSKSDLLMPEEQKKISKKKITGYTGKVLVFSSATKSGLQDLLDELWQNLQD